MELAQLAQWNRKPDFQTFNSPMNRRHSNCAVSTDPLNLKSDMISYNS